jgi:hypothetical protein
MLWGPGLHEIQCTYSEGTARIWVPCERRRPFERIVRADNCFVSAVPRTSEDSLSYGESHILWARLDRPEAGERLGKVPLAPTLVLREGRSSRRYALWALSRPLSGAWIDQANARLSHACKGRRSAGNASALILSPFTRLTRAARPVKVYVEFESGTIASARDVVGRLPDAPATDGWRQAA